MFSPKSRILIIDDMKTMRMVCKSNLKKLGFENIVEADDGETAWPLIQQSVTEGQPFAFILSDWNMPRMQGIELLMLVRKDPATKNIPFIMVTAESEKEQVMKAIQAGVSHYLTKPFTLETLEDRLKKVSEIRKSSAA